MATLLLFIIFLVFIGLGLPDSVFGSAWPAIRLDIDLPISFANFITCTISLGTVTASLFAAKLINKFGTGPITAVSTSAAALALLGFSLSNSGWFMILLALPLGLGAGAIDSALNNFVALHYSARTMNFLHCFYGVGVSASPLLISLTLSNGNDWRGGYRLVFFILVAITIFATLAIPLWKKVQNANEKEKQTEKKKPKSVSLITLSKMPAARWSWLLFFSTCGLEFTCGIWGSSFFVGAEHLSEATAASYVTFYYVGITAGRFVSGLLSGKMTPQNIVYTGYSIVFLAIVALFLPIPPILKGVALFMIGFGNGPTFPNCILLTPYNFGSYLSQSVVATQMACCNLGILLMPPVFGFIADFISIELFPVFLMVLFVFMAVSTVIYNKRAATLKKGI